MDHASSLVRVVALIVNKMLEFPRTGTLDGISRLRSGVQLRSVDAKCCIIGLASVRRRVPGTLVWYGFSIGEVRAHVCIFLPIQKIIPQPRYRAHAGIASVPGQRVLRQRKSRATCVYVFGIFSTHGYLAMFLLALWATFVVTLQTESIMD